MPPLIMWNPDKPRFHTRVREESAKLAAKFTLQNLFYIGSDQGCGCGFRSIPLNANFPEAEKVYSEGVELQKDTQHNHVALADYLRNNFKSEEFIELYGCWGGEESEDTQFSAEITVQRIGDPTFCFRERGFYRVLLQDTVQLNE